MAHGELVDLTMKVPYGLTDEDLVDVGATGLALPFRDMVREEVR